MTIWSCGRSCLLRMSLERGDARYLYAHQSPSATQEEASTFWDCLPQKAPSHVFLCWNGTVSHRLSSLPETRAKSITAATKDVRQLPPDRQHNIAFTRLSSNVLSCSNKEPRLNILQKMTMFRMPRIQQIGVIAAMQMHKYLAMLSPSWNLARYH